MSEAGHWLQRHRKGLCGRTEKQKRVGHVPPATIGNCLHEPLPSQLLQYGKDELVFGIRLAGEAHGREPAPMLGQPSLDLRNGLRGEELVRFGLANAILQEILSEKPTRDHAILRATLDPNGWATVYSNGEKVPGRTTINRFS